jgi:hypothetical protein
METNQFISEYEIMSRNKNAQRNAQSRDESNRAPSIQNHDKLVKQNRLLTTKAGHYVHMDKTQELAQVVTRFFDEVPDEVAVQANCSLLSYA